LCSDLSRDLPNFPEIAIIRLYRKEADQTILCQTDRKPHRSRRGQRLSTHEGRVMKVPPERGGAEEQLALETQTKCRPVCRAAEKDNSRSLRRSINHRVQFGYPSLKLECRLLSASSIRAERGFLSPGSIPARLDNSNC